MGNSEMDGGFTHLTLLLIDRMGPPHSLVCRKRRLNGTVLMMRPVKVRYFIVITYLPLYPVDITQKINLS